MLSENSLICIEPLGLQDLAAALNLQQQAYPPFLVEKEAAIISRISLTASYCLVAKHKESLLGYLLAHGWTQQSPPSLGSVLVDNPFIEVLFIHDLAVSSASRGLGVGQKLILRAFELAAQDGLLSAELIAVGGAADYWRRLGFIKGTLPEELSDKLATYGTHACWMARDIP